MWCQWCHIDEFKREWNRRITVYGSVARYGPRTSCQAQGVESRETNGFEHGI